MPRKKIPSVVFNYPPQFLHHVTIKGRSYWLLDASPYKDGCLDYLLSWATECTVCGTLFVVESRLSVYRLYRRCEWHRRQTPQMQKTRIKNAMMSLKKRLR